MAKQEKLLLIDGNSIVFRAFYGMLNVRFTAPDGTPTNAIYGFMQIILKNIEEEEPDYIAVSFDMDKPLKRHEIYKDYKAGRMKMPEDLGKQIPIVKDILEDMGIKIYQRAGDEADDICGTIAKSFSKEGVEVVILTGDRDYFQLIDKNITVKYPKLANKKTEYIMYDEKKIIEEYGLKPIDLIQVKGLMGDSSDNIPGIAGVGEKTAIKLIKQYGNIDNIYSSIENDEDDISKGLRQKLIGGKIDALMSRKLGEILIDLDIEFTKEEMKYTDWQNEKVYDDMKKLNFNAIISKYDLQRFEDDSKQVAIVEKIDSEKKTIENLEKILSKTEKQIGAGFLKGYLEGSDYIFSYSYNETKSVMEQALERIKRSDNIYISFIKNNLNDTNSSTKKDDEEETVVKLIYDYFKNNLSDIKGDKIEDVASNITRKIAELEIDEKKKTNSKLIEIRKIADNSIQELMFSLIKKRKKEDNNYIPFGMANNSYSESISKEIIEYVSIMVIEEDNADKLKRAYIYTFKPKDVEEILDDNSILKVGHATKSDIVSLRENNMSLNGIIYDSEIAAYILNSGLSNYSISDVSLRTLGIDISEIADVLKYENEYIENNNKEENRIISSLKKNLKKVKKVKNGNEQKKSKKDDEEIAIKEIYDIETLDDIVISDDLKNEIEEDILKIIILKVLREKDIQNLENSKNYIPIIIYLLEKVQRKEIHKNSQDELLEKIEIPLIYVLADMQYNGMYLDTGELEEYGNELKDELKKLNDMIVDVAGYDINPSSPKQIGKLLFEDLKLGKGKKTKTGYSTSYDELKKIESKHEVVGYILKYREIDKLITTYVDGLKQEANSITGKIHSEFRQTVAATGRISSVNPNLQNIPTRKELGQEIRRCFKPANDYYVDADYSQIELRVLASMSNDMNMIKAFKDGMDIHRSTAATILSKDYDDVTSEERSSAKAVNFGIIYGISGYGLSENLKIPVGEATEYIEKYLDTYSSISDFMDKIVEGAKECGYVETLYNRRRYTPGINSKNYLVRESAKRIAMNSPIQGTAADIMKIAMNRVYNRLKKEGLSSKIVLQVHDELIIDTPKEEVEEVKKILKEEMENASDLGVSLIADVNCGENWNESK